ncbi:MAG: hypothetical protein M3270_00495 [Thermoproteota archaeon]|nr:hypothetical protein [Thermoproteota archaeon]
MAESQDNNLKNKANKVGDIDTSKIDDKAGIHSSVDSARHLERAQDKKVDIVEGNNAGSWQIKEKEES